MDDAVKVVRARCADVRDDEACTPPEQLVCTYNHFTVMLEREGKCVAHVARWTRLTG